MTKPLRYFIPIFGLTLCSLIFSLTKGSADISLKSLFGSEHIYLELRLPRTISAFVSGSLLALAGSLMQLLLQNPLADPYVLGISGGAALMSLLVIYLGLSTLPLVLAAWIGSFLAILLVFLFAVKHHFQAPMLLLCGIALSSAFSAAISFLLLMSPSTTLHSMLFWLSGDLNVSTIPWLALIILGCGYVICQILAPGLNILAQGEKIALSLGLATTRYRIILYALSSLLTACAVVTGGCIGFVGLIIPNLTRALVGYDNRYILPLSLLLGGSLVTIADTFARTLFSPLQLPVGILMALIGIPIFIWLLQK